jgi:hypothetical protein
MDVQLLMICLFTFLIHLIGTLGFSVRIAAVRTRKIALAFALFNVLALVSRTCNTFQTPFLAKRVENSLTAQTDDLLSDFRWIILCATLGTIAGAFLIPTFQRVFARAVIHFQQHRSLARLVFRGFSLQNLPDRVRAAVKLPALENIKELHRPAGFEVRMIALNVLTVALLTVGVFSALYAGALNPEYRVTASSLSAVINGVATVLMFVLIDPHLSLLTDDVMDGRVSEASFRRVVIHLVGARVAGTLLAQALFLPGASFIASVSRTI